MLRTEIDTFHHLVATLEQLLDASSQVLIPALLILYGDKEFKYCVSVNP